MQRFALLFFAAIGIGAAVQSLPSFTRDDAGKSVAITTRGLAYRYGVNGVIDVRDYGAIPNDNTDDLAAFTAALTAAANGVSGTTGNMIHIPRGYWDLSDTWHVNKHVRIDGDGPLSTVIRTPAARTGIIVHYENTAPNGVGNGAGSELSGFGLEPTANATAWQAAHSYSLGARVRSTTNIKDGLIFRCTTAGTSHASVEPTMPAYGSTVVDGSVTWTADYAAGIWLKASATVRNVKIGSVTASVGYAGHGLQVIANTSDSPPTNANGWRAERVTVQLARADGVRAQGIDANAGSFAHGTVSTNGGWGVRDASFLGNEWTNVISEANGTGSFYAPNASSVASFVDCYSESGEPAAKIIYPNSVSGSFVGGFTSDSTGPRITNGTMAGLVHTFAGNSSDGYVETMLSTYNSDPEIALGFTAYDGAQAVRNGTDLRLKYWTAVGAWRIDTANSDLEVGALIETERQATFDPGVWMFPHGIAIGSDSENYNTTGPYFRSSAAQPTTCRRVGDIYYNSGSSGPLGWRCASTSPVIWISILGATLSSPTAATGSTQANATQLTTAYDSWNVTGADGAKGAALPTGPTGHCIRVMNAAHSTLKIYPNNADNDTINGAAADAAWLHEPGVSLRYCLPSDATNWYTY